MTDLPRDHQAFIGKAITIHEHTDAAKMPFLANESVDCVVTSPPYNCGIDYPNGYIDYHDWSVYKKSMYAVLVECYRVLKPGGRIWVNVMPAVPSMPREVAVGGREPGEKPTRKTAEELGIERVNLAAMWSVLLERARFKYRETVVWLQDSYDGGTAWGSWLSPTAPNTRGSWEPILHYYKPNSYGGYKREKETASLARWRNESYKEDRPDKEQVGDPDAHPLGGRWEDLCRNVWDLPTVRRAPTKKTSKEPMGQTPGFPARFPIELPARCIRLSTWPGDKVLDPFAGSATTGFAADLLDRRSVMVDIGEITPMPPKDYPPHQPQAQVKLEDQPLPVNPLPEESFRS